ncbi:cell division cycle 7-related protein kinase [Ixodes scapularis]|uniref:cell division cycle 7-related protein kinase n=1 Tax=Ixodes scapularis TaxID=6945 RepID=UPI001A9E1321|nr:cell division cycle 7-related protein kinase [Ixodes scapularis]
MALQVIQPLERISVESKESRLVQNLSKASVSLKGVVNRDVKVTVSGTTQSTCLSASSNSVKDSESLCLHAYIPQINKHFNLDGKVGEGTFSHVYKARLKAGSASTVFAIKFLIPTSHPSRIANELKCLRDIGGSCNVMDVKTCFLHKGHVAIVMPYFPHEKFSDYVCKLSVSEVQEYMRQLLIALRRVHSFNIIHRDIKPSNFLYSRKLKRFSLVDFGLAQRLDEAEGKSTVSKGATSSEPHSRKRGRTTDQENQRSQLKRQCFPAHPGQPLHASNVPNVTQVDSMGKKPLQAPTAAAGATVLKGGAALPTAARTVPQPRRIKTKLCCCFGRNEVCNICLSRPAEVAPRAGTPGFRAPEVLLKYKDQSTAVDLWSVGVIFLSLLSGRYPFFRAQDDLTALAEIITITGSVPVQLAAERMGKRLTLSHQKPTLDLKVLCEKLRGTYASVRETSAWGSAAPAARLHPRGHHESWLCVPDSAYGLLSRLLDPDPASRITADQALQHEFLRETVQ